MTTTTTTVAAAKPKTTAAEKPKATAAAGVTLEFTYPEMRNLDVTWILFGIGRLIGLKITKAKPYIEIPLRDEKTLSDKLYFFKPVKEGSVHIYKVGTIKHEAVDERPYVSESFDDTDNSKKTDAVNKIAHEFRKRGFPFVDSEIDPKCLQKPLYPVHITGTPFESFPLSQSLNWVMVSPKIKNDNDDVVSLCDSVVYWLNTIQLEIRILESVIETLKAIPTEECIPARNKTIASIQGSLRFFDCLDIYQQYGYKPGIVERVLALYCIYTDQHLDTLLKLVCLKIVNGKPVSGRDVPPIFQTRFTSPEFYEKDITNILDVMRINVNNVESLTLFYTGYQSYKRLMAVLTGKALSLTGKFEEVFRTSEETKRKLLEREIERERAENLLTGQLLQIFEQSVDPFLA